MNAIELNLLIDILERRGEDRQLEAATMLRKQAKEIAQLKVDLHNDITPLVKQIEILVEDVKNKNINIEYLKEKLIASIDDIKTLKAELEDCTCQGGHSEAYLKVKGKK